MNDEQCGFNKDNLCPSLCFSSLVSIIRGQVLTADGTPLIGVNVTFVHFPEHGYSVTRQDGMCVFIYYLHVYTIFVNSYFISLLHMRHSLEQNMVLTSPQRQRSSRPFNIHRTEEISNCVTFACVSGH